MKADPRPLTREDLSKFLPNQRAVRAFEKLFDLIPNDLLETFLLAGSADAKAESAHAILNNLQQLVDWLALAPTENGQNQVQTDYIEFNRFGPSTRQPTQMGWNEEDGTVEIGMGYDGVIQQVGLETYFRIKASADITNGDVVMFTGAVGASGVVTGAPASAGLADGHLIMGVATMDIANNGFGYVTCFGLVRGIRTDGVPEGETWNDGDLLYYNPAAVGRLTNVKPTVPNTIVIVAAVVHATSGNSGSITVRPDFLPYLDDLSDVDAPAPVIGDMLAYDGTKWTTASGSSAPVVYGAMFYEHDQTITVNHTVAATRNARTTGNVTIASGVTVTIDVGGRWSVV